MSAFDLQLILVSSPQVKRQAAGSRKRNPYSIEELLKKPDKRKKIEVNDSLVEKERKKDDCEAIDEQTLNVEVCD